jgi:hypothetical protein
MSKKASLTDVSTGYTSGATLNSNFEALNDKFDNTLSLDGSTPNKMGSDLDLDSNDLLNVNKVNANELYLNGARTLAVGSTPLWRGSWTTGVAYALNDIVSQAGNTYICLVAHTAGTFATDLTSVYWELFAQKGAAGAGTGDMLAANDLSDVASIATSRANLGLGTAAVAATTDFATAAQGTLADNALPASDLANRTQAETGTNNTKYMTPLRTAQAITEQVVSDVKAWINFKGTGPVVINASKNVASLVRNSTGDYTITFTDAMADNKYAVSASGRRESLNEPGVFYLRNLSPGSLRIVFGAGSFTLADMDLVTVTVVR